MVTFEILCLLIQSFLSFFFGSFQLLCFTIIAIFSLCDPTNLWQTPFKLSRSLNHIHVYEIKSNECFSRRDMVLLLKLFIVWEYAVYKGQLLYMYTFCCSNDLMKIYFAFDRLVFMKLLPFVWGNIHCTLLIVRIVLFCGCNEGLGL
jgi:hypothetical protein